MIKIREEATELALCVGTIAALVWGIALSFYALHVSPGEGSWIAWGAQLFGGVLACLIVPLVWVRCACWVTARLGEARAREEVRPS